jgi:diamine N-acetyltransferase
MQEVTLRAVTQENWLATLALEVEPDQQRFVAGFAPIAAIALAKAYIRPGGALWEPYAIYMGSSPVGFIELAYTPASADDYWIFHFFIDRRFQGRGYGRAALATFIAFVRANHAACTTLQLVVHPENHHARQFYINAGFRPTGSARWGEPIYQLALIAPPSHA